ncbi:MAG: mechanosensitive ion channel family protein [Candidatus Diapherotrites archaeon]|nr:mechanosensitive ion channel family protein [Candidatus Diapherotrites archaeon]
MDTSEAILIVVLAILFRPFIKPFIYMIAKLTKSELDDKIIEASANPLWFIVLLYASDYLIREYWVWAYSNVVHTAILSVIAVLFAVLAARIIRIIIFDVFAKSKVQGIDEKNKVTALIVLYNIGIVVVATIALFYILTIWGVDIGPLLASAGIVGLAIGLALKDPLENMFYGIVLALDKNFRVGDAVQIGDISGVVEEIGLRNTKIRTWDGNLVLMPNAQVANSKITNYEFPDERVRTSIVIGVSYDSDPNVVKQTLLDVAKANDKVLDDPAPVVLFTEFGDSALMFKLLYWTKRADKWTTLDEMNTAILRAFSEKGIDIPYPITTVYLHRESGN